MPVVQCSILIYAPIDVCFDLARDIDLHTVSMGKSREKAIGGVTSGLIGPGEEVTWEATHFGIRQHLTSRITIFERPHRFRDSQVRGAFASFDHDHVFVQEGQNTRMSDVFDFRSPMGWLGRLVDVLVLKRYMLRLLESRAQAIKEAAERQSGKSASKALY